MRFVTCPLRTHQNYFRDYDPIVGRYVESDPIGLTGGLNTYTYVFGNRTAHIDSLGLYGYGDVMPMWNHYCDGTGTDRSTSFDSINWGDTESRAVARVIALIGQSCAERSIPVGFNINAQTAGADAYIIGRHVVKVGGSVDVHCDCTWSFKGSLSSNRGFIGESLTCIGRQRCPNSGKPFNIHLPGQQAATANGAVSGAPTCCHQ